MWFKHFAQDKNYIIYLLLQEDSVSDWPNMTGSGSSQLNVRKSFQVLYFLKKIKFYQEQKKVDYYIREAAIKGFFSGPGTKAPLELGGHIFNIFYKASKKVLFWGRATKKKKFCGGSHNDSFKRIQYIDSTRLIVH